MKFKLTLLAILVAAFGTGLSGGTAYATSEAELEALIAAHPNYQIEDDDVENQREDGNGNSLLDVGDTLRGIADFPFLRDLGTLDSFALDDLSAIFEVEVTSKVASVTPGRFDFTFGPDADFATEFGYPAGAMIAFYLEDGVDTPLAGAGCSTEAQCEGNVTDGDLVLVLGFSGGGENWNAIGAPDDTSAGNAVPPSTTLGQFNFKLEVLLSTIAGINVGDPWTGSGSVLGSAGVNNPYDVTSDSDLQPVPEPTTLGLMGFGLLGLAGMARLIRRRVGLRAG